MTAPRVPTRSESRRFWTKVDKNGPVVRAELGPCWIWTGAKTRDDYGRMKFAGKDMQTHRVSYLVHVGEIPPGLLIRHKSDVRSCVNLDHLQLGTHADNNRDTVERGRGLRGERANGAKLTKDQVFAIRVLFAAGESTRYELAERFRVTHRTICYVIKGRSWKYEPPAADAGRNLETKDEP